MLLTLLCVACPAVSADISLLRGTTIMIPASGATDDNYRLFINGVEATNYSAIENDQIIFENPFPERKDVFTVKVLAEDSQEQLFEGKYRNAKPGEIFDHVEFHTSGQLDSAFVDEQMPRPEPDFEFSGSTSESDLLGALSMTAQRGNFNSVVDLEVVNRTDPDATLRFDGPNADLSRFQVQGDYRTTGGSVVYLKAGDIDMASSVNLVNSGFASRGIAIGFSTSDGRLTAEAGRLFGTDIVGAVRGPIAWNSESYRTGVLVDLNITSNENISWSMHGSMMEVRRPADSSYGISESAVGETNNVLGFGTTISAFDERMRLNMNWASSKYDNPAELNELNLPDEADEEQAGGPLEVFDPGATSGSAFDHSLTWSIWSGKISKRASSFDLDMKLERATPLYRSMHGSGTADRKTWSSAFSVIHGPISGRIGTTQFRNNLDDLISIHTLDEAIHEASIDIDLEAFRKSSDTNKHSTRLLMPSSIGFSVQIEDMKTLNGESIILAPVIEGFDFMDQTTETLGLNLSWEGLHNLTTVDLSYSFLDNDQRERAAADRRDIYYGISHDITHEKWSIGGRLGFNYTDDLDTVSRSENAVAEWGLNASFYADHGVSYSLSFDNSRDNYNDFVFDEREKSTADRYSISADFGDFVQQKLKLTSSPSITASWQKTDTSSVSSFYDSDTSSSSLTINLGLSF